MPEEQNHALPLTAPLEEQQTRGLPEEPSVSAEALRARAEELKAHLHPAKVHASDAFETRLDRLRKRLGDRSQACRRLAQPGVLTPALEFLESSRMFEGVLTDAREAERSYEKLPFVAAGDDMVPRIVRVAEEYISAVKGVWSSASLEIFLGSIQGADPLLLREVYALPGALRVAQLEFVLDRGDEALTDGADPAIENSPFSAPIHSLRRLNQFEWPTLLERLLVFHHILADDPAGAYLVMDDESRESYRTRIAELAMRSDASEVEVASTAIHMAQEAAASPFEDARQQRRVTHVGYYLFEEGFVEFTPSIGYHPTLLERLRTTLRHHNEEVYILGIALLSVLLIAGFMVPVVPHSNFVAISITLLVALLPATQGAADLVNNTISALFPPRALPKLDYHDGIEEAAATLVVIPTLLLRESQVCGLFDEMEARFLANQDRRLHFALLTDLPDSQERPQQDDQNELVEQAVRLTNELNRKYDREKAGCFLLLHRHRVFNSRQGVWMGWERKRGKLLDLNRLLMGAFDSFPVKAGPLEVLRDVRYVITLDADTQLPRGTAARMVGAMHHPLNQAIVDPRTRTVKAGYGILQPRVGVSVASASRSRLAALFSGETGFDIYTRAVSDVYQDFFGEGIFTGKGIYDVAILHQVLDGRFPPNFLLSHDLIEGSYARAGLATDIEVIDDYPSHYSAHTRRKHRWVRGDWQIVQWLSGRVPDESGKPVPNPISLLSQWKIFDNLRRSLVEPVTFLLLVFGWFVLPGGARYWTLVLLTLLLLPVFVQLAFQLGRAAVNRSAAQVTGGFETFVASLGVNLLYIAFLPHQMLLSVDAIVRSLVRRFVTGKRLLEWETAAQSEENRERSTLDRYLQVSPLVALAVVWGLFSWHREALWSAGPVLALWISSPFLAGWLDSPPRRAARPLSTDQRRFLEEEALLIWRYFAEFGGEQNHWLIPDNVEERELFAVRKLSPTNLGMLLNARQAAVRLGFITLPEFALATRGTFATYERLAKWNGHIYNWYDIEALKPLAPRIVSTVDNGNLAASLYALHGGLLDVLKHPALGATPFAAIARMAGSERNFDSDARGLHEAVQWLVRQQIEGSTWKLQEAARRRSALLLYVEQYLPWMLPQYDALLAVPEFEAPENTVIPAPEHAAEYARAMAFRVAVLMQREPENAPVRALAAELHQRLQTAAAAWETLAVQLTTLSQEAEQHADAMRFDLLFVPARQLLSIAYDVDAGQLHSACYDLLASEARIASFLAVAKGDIPQRAWFRLDRTHTLVKGHAALLSWTGTMFEYMMPALWTRSYPDTLLTRSLASCVAIQQKHVRRIPWGISESGYAQTDAQGRYAYQAWGVPALALKYGADDGPVISPYSTFLALSYDRERSLANLKRMAGMGWQGDYGFYEAADCTGDGKAKLVRSWMAHHQGMSLLAATNLLCDNAVQKWFHANPKVRAAELLLHERPLSRQALRTIEERSRVEKEA